ncbi:MAG: leucine-rich repeat protein [Clostridia bacterium]|nr:leucine-rich repeat protein [Clostridia bacterium]
MKTKRMIGLFLAVLMIMSMLAQVYADDGSIAPPADEMPAVLPSEYETDVPVQQPEETPRTLGDESAPPAEVPTEPADEQAIPVGSVRDDPDEDPQGVPEDETVLQEPDPDEALPAEEGEVEDPENIADEQEKDKTGDEQTDVAPADEAETAYPFEISGDTLIRYSGEDKIVTIPDGIRVIGYGAFANNSKIERVILPDSVEIISGSAFANCDNLAMIVRGTESKLKEIGPWAFRNDTRLSTAFIVGVKTVADTAFDGVTTETEEDSEAEQVTAPQDDSTESIELQDAAGTEEDSAEPETNATLNQLQDVRALAGETVTFAVRVSGSNLRYQWQVKTSSAEAWKDTGLSGNKTDTLSFTAQSSFFGRQYRCLVTYANGQTSVTNAATLLRYAFGILEHPTSVTAQTGETVTFSVTAKGDGLKYQWQVKTDATADWKDTTLSGNKTNKLSFTVMASYLDRQYRCVVTDGRGNTQTSKAAALNRYVFRITNQPQSLIAATGETAAFTVAAEGEGLKYQWQVKTDTTAEWKDTTLSGNKTNKLSFTVMASYLDRQYRCVVTDGRGNTQTSKAAALNRYVFRITNQPQSMTAAVGETANFTVAVEGESLQYRWQVKTGTDAEWQNTTLSGCKTACLSFTVVPTYCGRQYRCVVTDGRGNTLTSAAVTLTQYIFRITSQPVNAKVAMNEAATFTVSAQGDNLQYRWQVKTDANAEWKNTTLTGCKTATLTFTALQAYFGRQYRCVVTDARGNSLESRAVTLNQYFFEISKQPVNAEAIAGETVTFAVTAKGSGLQYCWQERAGASYSWQNSTQTGCLTATLSVKATTSLYGHQYRCIVTDDRGHTLTSDIATLSKYIFEITSQPADSMATVGQPATFTVTAAGTKLQFQWQVKTGATADWKSTTLAGNKTNRLSFTVMASYLGRQYRCVITDARGNTLTTRPVVIAPQITVSSNRSTAVLGEQVVLTAKIIGNTGTVSYQWQQSANGGSSWSACTYTGNRTASMSFSASKDALSRIYRCVLTENGRQWTSETISVAYVVKTYISSILANRDGSVVIKWPEIPGATYTLYYLKGSTGTPTTVYKSGITGTSITVTGLTFKTTYRFCLTATVGGVTSEKSAAVNVKVRGRIYRALLIGQVHFARETANRNWGDVNLMYNVITSRYTPIGTRYQTPVKKSDRTPSQVLSDISSAFSGADEDDISLFFIATHGDSTSNGRYAGALECVDGNKKSYMLYLDELANALKAVPGEIIAVIESCGSGAAVYQEGVAQNGTEEEGDTLSTGSIVSAFSGNNMISEETVTYYFDEEGNEITLQDRTGEFRVAGKFYVLCASRYHENSYGYEGSNPRNVFTDFLCKGIGTSGSMPADTNYDYYVTLYEAFAYIKRCEDTDQHVQAYPSGSSYQLFKR